MRKIFKQAILILISFLIMPALSAQNQKDMAVFLKQKFVEYCKAVPREEVFLHSDREDYMSGEDMWFNAYLIDRQSFKPSLNSRIVYFELLNSVNRPVVQKRFLAEKGIGPGQIHLPDTLSTGRYTVRAYTSWMKNFLPSNCFMKTITVYNSLGNNFLMSGIKKGNRNDDSKALKTAGVILKVNNADPGTLNIQLETDENFRTENNNSFCIFIQTHGNINHVSNEKTDGRVTELKLSRAELSEGINQITVFNMKGVPVAEKFIYTPLRKNNFLTMTAADSCGLRDKIVLAFKKSSPSDSAFFSVSATPLINNNHSPDIIEYLIFGSEFGVELVKKKSIDAMSVASVDSILQNVHSNWINWHEILSDKLPALKYPMEKVDHYILGQLVSSTQEPVNTPSYILLCRPGKEAGFQYARTDENGNFKFKIHIDEELKDLVIMQDEVNADQKILIESSFSDRYFGKVSVADTVLKVLPSGISKLSVNNQVQKIYGIPALGAPMFRDIKPLKPIRFYGKPDIELIMADYIKLPAMSEVFYELLPSVSLKKKITITYRIEDNQFSTTPVLMIDGVIIKDASLISNLDPEYVEKIDVVRENYMVGKYVFPGLLNVITKAGDFSNVTLPSYMIRIPYRVIEPVSSFVSPDYSTSTQRENRIPDYRNTIYWNPQVATNSENKTQAELWTSDNPGKYVINVQGITKNGKLISITKVLKVR
jgi:hypothetical protein